MMMQQAAGLRLEKQLASGLQSCHAGKSSASLQRQRPSLHKFDCRADAMVLNNTGAGVRQLSSPALDAPE
jgi:hypothetical protein